MKKITFLLVMIIATSILINASERVNFIKGEEYGLNILSHDNSSTKIHINLTGINVDKKDGFDILTINGGQLFTGNTGKPQIPYFRRKIAIPDRGDVSIEIVNMKTMTLTDAYRIIPAQLPLFDMPGISNEFVYDNEFYSTNTSYPATIAEVKDIGNVRSFRYAELYIYPVQYNPSTGELQVIYDFDVIITYEGAGPNEINRTIPVSDRWKPIYELMFDNWEYVKNSKPEINQLKYETKAFNENTYFDEGDYLILVVSDEMAYKIRELAAWKTKLGYRPVIKQVPASISVSAVYDTIADCYNNWSIPPEFVLIVGEGEENEVSNHIEAHAYSSPYSYGVESGITRNDHYYSLMPTSDRHSDLFISRIPARDSAELGVWIDKVKEYEGNPPSGTWFTSYFAIGDMESGRIFDITARQFGLNLENDGFFDDLDTLLESNFANGEMGAHVVDSIDEGHNIMLFRGHGDEGSIFGFYGGGDYGYDDMFMAGDVPNMSTESMGMGFMFAPTCLANNYTYPNYESMGELMVNMTGKGITGYFGATNVSLSFYNDSMALGISHAITGASSSEFQVVSVYGKEYMETYTGGSDTYFELEHYLMNEVGDPAARIWTKSPQTLYASHNPSYFIGLNDITINVTDGSSNVSNAIVTIWDTTGADTVYEMGVTDGSGNITFTGVDFIDEGVGELMITASKQDYIPYEGYADIEAGNRISYVSSIVLDSPSPILTDAKLNNGEITDIDITVKNNTGSNQNTVSGTLHTSNAYISITTNTDSYGNIASDGTSDGTFRVSVSSNAPHGENVEFDLYVTYAGKTDTSTFTLTVQGVSYVSSDKSELIFDYFGSKSKFTGSNLLYSPSKTSHKAVTGYDTLSYDNYPSESNLRSGIYYWGVKFSPASVCSLKTVFWGRSNTNSTLTDTIYVYSDNAGQPGTLLDKQAVSVGTGGTRIVEFNYDGPAIDGDFWILMYGRTKSNGGTRYYMVSDNSNSGNSYTASSVGGTWSSYSGGDIVIRAGIAYYTLASDSGTIFVLNNDPDSRKDITITSIDVKNGATWIPSVNPTSGVVNMGDSMGITVYIDTVGLDPLLTYTDTLLIYTDADLTKAITLEIPVIIQNISTGILSISAMAFIENNDIVLQWHDSNDRDIYISRTQQSEVTDIIDIVSSHSGMNKYRDTNAPEGVNYYSLGIKGNDGIVWSSPLIIVRELLANDMSIVKNIIGKQLEMKFSIANESAVNIGIYDMSGRLVKDLLECNYHAGKYTANYDIQEIPSGLYFIQIRTDGFTKTQKISIIK